jgi:hypothetical protein
LSIWSLFLIPASIAGPICKAVEGITKLNERLKDESVKLGEIIAGKTAGNALIDGSPRFKISGLPFTVENQKQFSLAIGRVEDLAPSKIKDEAS